MNIQSIHSTFHELEVFIETLHNIDFKFNVICLQECWLSDETDSISIQLPVMTALSREKVSVPVEDW